MEGTRGICLRPRLLAAEALLEPYATVADVGCDHGRLCCRLAQRGKVCIGTDVSAPSLEKARRLAKTAGVLERVSFREGDGLTVLRAGEAEAVAVLGMGGSLIAQLLDAAQIPLMGAKIAVFQPMRGVADLRRYLFMHGYRILTDRVICDAGRLYQVFSAGAPEEGLQTLPAGWPEGCFDLGFRAWETDDPLFFVLAAQQLGKHEKRLSTARGTAGAALLERKAADMRAILRLRDGKGDGTCN